MLPRIRNGNLPDPTLFEQATKTELSRRAAKAAAKQSRPTPAPPTASRPTPSLSPVVHRPTPPQIPLLPRSSQQPSPHRRKTNGSTAVRTPRQPSAEVVAPLSSRGLSVAPLERRGGPSPAVTARSALGSAKQHQTDVLSSRGKAPTNEKALTLGKHRWIRRQNQLSTPPIIPTPASADTELSEATPRCALGKLVALGNLNRQSRKSHASLADAVLSGAAAGRPRPSARRLLESHMRRPGEVCM